jgi:hypothetical protein
MFSIDMGGCDIVLGVEWLRTMGPILMDFKELTMQFHQEGQNINSKDSQQVLLRSSVPIEWKSFSRKVIQVLFPNSIPFKQLRHPLCILTSNLSSPNTKLFFPLLRDFPLPMVFMIIPFPLFLTVFLPMFSLIIIPFPKRMKLRKCARVAPSGCYPP